MRSAAGVALAGTIFALAAPAVAGRGYRYHVIGRPADVVKPTRGLIVLQGGGTDVDQNYVAMGERGGGGDFVVLRASGGDEYNEYVYKLCGCNSVETIVFKDRKASFDPFVIATIRNAEALFLAGGDQSRYVRMWKDTPVEDAIHHVAAKPAPIGGTSAGMAILGEFSYSAMTDSSLTSEEGLADPFHHDLTLAREFLKLPYLQNTITDQHLQERDRIGRTVALLARLVHDGWVKEARAIAADRETALHIDPRDGSARVFSTPDHPTPFVYFLRTPGPPEVCAAGKPLTYRGIAAIRVGPGGTFDLRSWRSVSGDGGIEYSLSVEDGALASSRGAVY